MLSFVKGLLSGSKETRQSESLSEGLSESRSESDHIRRRQILMVVGIGLVVLVSIVVVKVGFKKATAPQQRAEKPRKAVIGDFVDDRDVWASRLEAQVEKMASLANGFKAQNELQEHRLNLLEKAVLSQNQTKMQSSQNPSSSQDIKKDPSPPRAHANETHPPLTGPSLPVTGLSGKDLSRLSGISQNGHPPSSYKTDSLTKILHYSVSSPQTFHSVDDYVVSGSYARAVLTSGVVVSTAVETQGQPQPIVMRLGDNGNLPRGWKSRLKDAVLIGSCYGDLSAERALCRIHSLSYVNAKGHALEKKVEGWVIGEDGAPGLRGKVVDRAGSIAREAMIAGVLSGMSNFLKNEANSSVFPKTPFGQTNALNGSDAMKTGVGSGASNALEKLADFSIKRAESMSPVLVVNPGRVVDVVFKSGFDLRPVDNKHRPYQRVSGQQNSNQNHAHQKGSQ